jgi:hypothetical protein
MASQREKNITQNGTDDNLGESDRDYAGPERRVSRRIPLRFPVRVCVTGDEYHDCRVVDINLGGLALQPVENAQLRQTVAIAFEGFPGVVPPFTLSGEVVRVSQNDPSAVGLKVNRSRNTPEAAGHYRNLIRYYLRHRPLLEEVNSGYFEGRCSECGWVGRVGRRRPNCSRCGGFVKPLHGST